MGIIEVQFSIDRINTLLQNALHESFLAMNVFDTPDYTRYLIHHVELNPLSFTLDKEGVHATVNPIVHFVSFADVIATPNQMAMPSATVTLTLPLTFVATSDVPGQFDLRGYLDGAFIDFSDVSLYLPASQGQLLQTALNQFEVTVDLLQFLPLPALSSGLQIVHCAVSLDEKHLAVRADTDGGDLTFDTFKAGVFSDRLQGKDWAVFVAQEYLSPFVWSLLKQTLDGVPPNTSWPVLSTTWVASPPSFQYTGIQDLLFESEFTDTSVFELAPYFVKSPQGASSSVLRIDTTCGQQIKGPLPVGATSVSSSEFTLDITLPQIDMLGAQGHQGFVSGATDGLVVGGGLTLSPLQDADLAPAVEPFSWFCYSACSDHWQSGGATLDNVQTHASASLGSSNQPGINRSITIWYLRQYMPPKPNQAPSPADPLGAFSPYLNMPTEGASVTSFTIDIAFGAKDFLTHHASYWSAPYPCTLLCVTSAGAIYLNLGEVAALQIDPKTGTVLNARVISVRDCHWLDVDPWLLHFRNSNPIWAIDPYVGEMVENIAAKFTAGQIIQATLEGARPGEELLLTSQDMAAQTSERVLVADRRGSAQVVAYLPLSANPAPLRLSRPHSHKPLRLTQMERTTLTQSARMPVSARIVRVVGAVAHARPLLQVITAEGEQTFDLSDPGSPQPIKSGHLTATARRGFWSWLMPWRQQQTVALPAGLARIGADLAVAVDERHNSVVIFHARTRRENLHEVSAASFPSPTDQAPQVAEESAPTRSVLVQLPR